MSEARREFPDPSARLVAAYEKIHATRTAGLPFLNPALAVEAVGFAQWEGRWLGVMVTPWFMNLMLLACDPARWTGVARGGKRRYAFPAGIYEFIGGEDESFGEYQACSLFSPVLQFETHGIARLVATLARDALFDAGNAEATEEREAGAGPAELAGKVSSSRWDAPLSRRELLHGHLTETDHESRR